MEVPPVRPPLPTTTSVCAIGREHVASQAESLDTPQLTCTPRPGSTWLPNPWSGSGRYAAARPPPKPTRSSPPCTPAASPACTGSASRSSAWRGTGTCWPPLTHSPGPKTPAAAGIPCPAARRTGPAARPGAARADLKTALQARWEGSLRERAQLCPRSIVPTLDALLAVYRQAPAKIRSQLAPKIGHRGVVDKHKDHA
jgi:hypothetical protein